MNSFLAKLLAVTVAMVPLAPIGAFSTQHSCRRFTALKSTPNFGDWTNDDFLNSLGGDGTAADGSQTPPQQQQQVSQNDLTDDEITEMALRAAQFYNTDTSIEEAYGVKRDGPPRKNQENGQ
jgi:hypothetical protein